MLPASGKVTARVNATATAASTAFPPCDNMRCAVSAPKVSATASAPPRSLARAALPLLVMAMLRRTTAKIRQPAMAALNPGQKEFTRRLLTSQRPPLSRTRAQRWRGSTVDAYHGADLSLRTIGDAASCPLSCVRGWHERLGDGGCPDRHLPCLMDEIFR